MDGKRILDGKFTFKKLSNGSLDKTKVVCELCYCELSYHRSTSSLKYHLKAKHTADANGPPFRQSGSTMDDLTQKHMDITTRKKLTEAIAKWLATAHRPATVVEDEGLVNIIRIASNDWTYKMPSRATITNHVHRLHETETTGALAFTEDSWTSPGESLSEFMPGPCTRPDAASSSPVKRQLHYNGSQQGSGCKRPKKTKASDASEDSEDVGDDMKSYMAPLDTDSDEMDSDNATQAPGVDGYAQVRPPVNLKEEEEISLELPRPVCDPSDPPEINEPPPAAVESDPAAAACLPSLPPTPGSSSVIPAPPALSPPRPDAKSSVPGPSCDAESFWKSCNESGKTQAIFAHFFARMQSIASKIQAEQANAEDCDVALKVMEVSGELEFQQKDITKTICALQKTADAMTRAISAAST